MNSPGHDGACCRLLAFTRRELVVIVIASVSLVLLLPGLNNAKRKAQNENCVNNLKQGGLAFREWTYPAGDHFAPGVAESFGGSLESATNGKIAFTFVVMSNEFDTPKLLVCPTDTRKPATNFGTGLANSNVSYFVGITADETQPRMLLMGDRNLTNGTLSSNRLLVLTTNSAPGWDQRLHKFRGNVALSDGSVQSATTPLLRRLLTNSGADNLLAFP